VLIFLFYSFLVRARAEFSRLLFAAAGVDFQDDSIGFDQWGPDSEVFINI
jgi:hypothetical protein